MGINRLVDLCQISLTFAPQIAWGRDASAMTLRHTSSGHTIVTSATLRRPALNRHRIIVAGSVLVDMLGYGLIMPLLPFMARAWSDDALVVGLLGSLYAAMQLLVAPMLGAVSDRIGRRSFCSACSARHWPILVWRWLIPYGSWPQLSRSAAQRGRVCRWRRPILPT